MKPNIWGALYNIIFSRDARYRPSHLECCSSEIRVIGENGENANILRKFLLHYHGLIKLSIWWNVFSKKLPTIFRENPSIINKLSEQIMPCSGWVWAAWILHCGAHHHHHQSGAAGENKIEKGKIENRLNSLSVSSRKVFAKKCFFHTCTTFLWGKSP